MFKLAQTTDAPHAEGKIPVGSLRIRKTASDQEEILLRAKALFSAEAFQDLREATAENIEGLRHYDLLAMEKVVAIVAWGRTGSLLLASYLDGHEDVIMLPKLCGEKLHDFFERYPSLPWPDKLLAYPAFLALKADIFQFFDGEFAISPAQYYAAVQAILEFCGKWPPEFLESRRAFFLLVHIAYNLALGRRPRSSHPLMVYALHEWDSIGAKHLIQDFPQAKFVHTIRDPISNCDRLFHNQFGAVAERFPKTYIQSPYTALLYLGVSLPHFGKEPRTRTIRFEDLHCDTANTIRDLCDWIGLPNPAILESTFNGVPWVVTRDGKSWTGRRVEHVQRYSRHLSLTDRVLLFALGYENFVEWNYPCPKIFGNSIVRCIVFVSLVLVPMKMEIIAARATFTRGILPSVWRGNISAATRYLLGIGLCRLKVIRALGSCLFLAIGRRKYLAKGRE